MQLSADFTPVSALVGGVLIGLSASLFLLVNGRIAGISGLVAGVVNGERDPSYARVAFLGGLLAAGLVTRIVAPDALGSAPRGLGVLVLAGLLVGVGTRLGRGCTSGHGVCGISRGSKGSFAATATFVGVGMVTATVFSLLAGQP